LTSITIAAGTIVGQGQPTATVTLSAAAPAGGALVRLESSNTDTARVPSNVTVAAGATTATFTVNTSTVDSKRNVTITAIYADVARTATLEITLPRPRASFTVTSPTLGEDKCRMIAGGLELDCRLDGSRSDGRIVRWQWQLEVQERISADKPDPGFNEIDVTCKFVTGRSGDRDTLGLYTTMSVRLEVTDRDGDQSTTSRNVRLYFDEVCQEDEDDDDD
jgi:hypothetical protein